MLVEGPIARLGNLIKSEMFTVYNGISEEKKRACGEFFTLFLISLPNSDISTTDPQVFSDDNRAALSLLDLPEFPIRGELSYFIGDVSFTHPHLGRPSLRGFRRWDYSLFPTVNKIFLAFSITFGILPISKRIITKGAISAVKKSDHILRMACALYRSHDWFVGIIYNQP